MYQNGGTQLSHWKEAEAQEDKLTESLIVNEVEYIFTDHLINYVLCLYITECPRSHC